MSSYGNNSIVLLKDQNRWKRSFAQRKRYWVARFEKNVENKCKAIAQKLQGKVNFDSEITKDDLVYIVVAVLETFGGTEGLSIEIITHYVNMVIVFGGLIIMEQNGQLEVKKRNCGPNLYSAL